MRQTGIYTQLRLLSAPIMNKHSLIAIYLAKNAFQVCIINSNNRMLMNKSFNRKTLTEFTFQQAPTIVAMEACYSSHYWT